LQVLDWFRRLRKATRKLVLPSRETNSARSQIKLDLSKFSPPEVDAVARLAAHHGLLIEILQPCVALAHDSGSRDRISAAVRQYRDQSRELAAEVTKLGADAADLIDIQSVALVEFGQALRGADYFERLISAYIGYGIIHDFFAELADVYPRAQANLVRRTVANAELWKWLASELQKATIADSQLSNRLALWGRSVVADCLLEVWRVLGKSSSSVRLTRGRLGQTEFREIEPLVTSLVASHSERMAALELTA
jgi:hypothetical protein